MTDQQTNMKPGPKNVGSALALANVAHLATGVLQGVAGRSLSATLNGSPLMRENIAEMVCGQVTKLLQERHQRAKNMRLQNY